MEAPLLQPKSRNYLMELQHINVKLLFNESADANLEPLISILHDWISNQDLEEILIDVADYRHVPDGPGIILIGHQANISLTEDNRCITLCYNRKIATKGTNEERFRQAVRGALIVCEKLELDERLTGKMNFECQEIEILINDRIFVSNKKKFYQILDPKFKRLFDIIFEKNEYSISHFEDPRKVYSIKIKTPSPLNKKKILQAL